MLLPGDYRVRARVRVKVRVRALEAVDALTW